MMWYAAAGVLFGIIGGMGMGGGIILIPVLTMLLGESQHAAQALNLAAFLPMSAFALFAHIKHKRVNFKAAFLLGGFGLIGAAAGALAANYLNAELLRRCFGGFLILLGFIRIFKMRR